MLETCGNGRERRPRVLVLGGGSAGIGTERKLKGANVDVVLVDRHGYHTFQPLRYQLATGLLGQTTVGHSLRDLVHGQESATVRQATVTAAVVQMLGGRKMKGKTAARPPKLACVSVHMALLPTNGNRAQAVVDRAGDALTHQRAGRIVVETDERRMERR